MTVTGFFDDLVVKAEGLKKEVEIAFEKSMLKARLDFKKVNELLVKVRDEYYKSA